MSPRPVTLRSWRETPYKFNSVKSSVDGIPGRVPFQEAHFGAQRKLKTPGGWNPKGSPGEERCSLKAYVDSDSHRSDGKSVSGVGQESSQLDSRIVIGRGRLRSAFSSVGIPEAAQRLGAGVLEQASIGQPKVDIRMYLDSSDSPEVWN
eukprot:2265170-Amphidinium_carterae.4